MFVRTFAGAVAGIDAVAVTVEVNIAGGGLGMYLVGLPDNAVKESEQRIRAAFENSGERMSGKKVVVSLAPADLRKEGSGFDLPIAVVGFGGYASAPVLWAAQRMGVPTVIQEQNSYAGVTNKILAKGARRICTAYEGMERFFPAAKIVLTGNPLRGRFSKEGADRAEALEYYGLTPDLPVILVVGGSLGTRSLNEMMKAWIVGTDGKAPVQVIWQTGKYYEREMQAFLAAHPAAHVWQGAFIDRMDYAYAAADLVVSRSGAGTVSELCLVAKPVLFVPSPNVAEDHQTKNARALETKGAAVVVPDAECRTKAMPRAVELLADRETLAAMSRNLEALARPDAAEDIVNEIVKVMK